MTQQTLPNSALEIIWGQYRSWSVTAQKLKKELTLWRTLVFILTIVGAFTAILSQLIVFETAMLTKLLGWISAGAIGIAGYAGSKIITSEKEKKWLQARAAAESCKSNAFLYLLQAEPYHQNDRDTLLLRKIENLIRSLYTIPQAMLSTEAQLKNVPPQSYSFDHYLNERILAQAKNYYLPKAALYRKFLNRSSNCGIALGAIGFLLGSLGSGAAASSAVWIAFISTVSASLTSFIASNRYQYLAMSFQATGNQLMLLWFRGTRLEKGDIEMQKDVIRNGEEILATENEAWMTELNKEVEVDKDNEAGVGVSKN